MKVLNNMNSDIKIQEWSANMMNIILWKWYIWPKIPASIKHTTKGETADFKTSKDFTRLQKTSKDFTLCQDTSEGFERLLKFSRDFGTSSDFKPEVSAVSP